MFEEYRPLPANGDAFLPSPLVRGEREEDAILNVDPT